MVDPDHCRRTMTSTLKLAARFALALGLVSALVSAQAQAVLAKHGFGKP